MIEKILAGFRCEEMFLAEIQKLAKSPSVVDQAAAVGLIGNGRWQPTSIEGAVRAMMGDNPIARAREWAETLKSPHLGQIWTERGEIYRAVCGLVISGEERGQSEEEKVQEATLRRRLQALSFVIEAQAENEEVGEGLDETIFLPLPATATEAA